MTLPLWLLLAGAVALYHACLYRLITLAHARHLRAHLDLYGATLLDPRDPQ